MEGKISWEEFLTFSNHLVDVSNVLSDGWALMGKKDVVGGTYLVKRQSSTIAETHTSLIDFEEVSLEEKLEDKSALTSSSKPSGGFTSEFHVLYNISYQVPVLYFNIWKNDGRLLSLEEVWEHVPLAHQEAVNFSKWNTLTQQEHPLLGKPFFQLHPCRTSELLSKLTRGNRLLSWLSSVAPAAGLQMPLTYASATLPPAHTEQHLAAASLPQPNVPK